MGSDCDNATVELLAPPQLASCAMTQSRAASQDVEVYLTTGDRATLHAEQQPLRLEPGAPSGDASRWTAQ